MIRRRSLSALVLLAAAVAALDGPPVLAQVSRWVAALRMDNAALTRPAIGPALLDTERFPDIRLQLRSLRRLDGERFTAEADVTMKGVTRPVSFPVTLRSDGRTAQMTGGFSLDRAAYGIGTQGTWNRLIGRQVRVDVSLATRSA